MKFAAFIMTYNRPYLIIEAIESLLRQTFPPEKILVVDNSDNFETKAKVERCGYANVFYHNVGYNSGPAGAAKIGLEILTKEGFDWIYWGDDDDPPRFNNCIELLLNNVDNKTGAIGAVGSKFDWSKGVRERYKDTELTGRLEVDTIGGGYCFIINSKVVEEGCLPNMHLFFGLEEFDFCQKIKKKGFKVYVLGELLYKYRKLNNKLNVDKKPSLVSIRTYATLYREYYTYRNSIYLMIYEYKNYRLGLYYISKLLGKSIFGYAKGMKFGINNMLILYTALHHALLKKLGYYNKFKAL